MQSRLFTPNIILGASDEEAMIRHFVARSRWYNRLVYRQAGEMGIPVLEVSTSTTLHDLLPHAIELLDRSAP